MLASRAMKNLPQTPDELQRSLIAIFPGLPRDFGASGESVFEDAGPTFESLLREFAHFHARHAGASPDRQLRRFAQLLAGARAQRGALAEAIDQCLLPQLRAAGAAQRLEAFLARAEAS